MSSSEMSIMSTGGVVLLTACILLLRTTETAIIRHEESTTQHTRNNLTFSQSELECFKKGKVLFEPDGKCYKLKEAGPCKGEQQWLVLDKEEIVSGNGRFRAVCRQCQCCAKPFQVFWPADGQCHKLLVESKVLCPSLGTVLQIDPFGEGECECKKDPPHARWDVQNSITSNGPCYPLYRRGPCDYGYIFVSSDNATKCKKDPCSQHNHGSSGAVFAAWEGGDGRCYKLGSKGPCQGNFTNFEIDPVTKHPTCVSRVNQIVDLPPICDTDQHGNCRKEITLPSEEEYISDLIAAAQKKRFRRQSRPRKYQNYESEG